MKTRNYFRSVFTVALFSAALLFTACDKDDDDNNGNTFKIAGDASGSQEVPAVTSTATATLTGSYNDKSNTLNYNISWTGLSDVVTNAHFHGPALTGANADPIHTLTITTNGTSGVASGSVVIADSTEAHLLSGKIYYNLHTVLNPTGEIRGQVSTTPD